MYTPVNTYDYEPTDTEMDDRDSIYFDTISVAGSEPNRKSLSLSRQTIYHSADDLPAYETVITTPMITTITSPTRNPGVSGNDGTGLNRYQQLTNNNYNINVNNNNNNNNNLNNNNHNIQIGDYPLLPPSSSTSLQHGKFASANNIRKLNNYSPNRRSLFRRQSTLIDVGDYRDITTYGNDEVSDRLIDNCCNRVNKKLPITYSQWKSRTWRRFQDGERSVDFILAYYGDDINPENLIKRQIFETNLETEGLELEREKTQKIHFLKIHAPLEVLSRYCEILKMSMPTKKLKEQESISEPEFQLCQRMKSFFGRPFSFIKLNRILFPEPEYTLMFEYSRNYNYLFDVENPNFFNTGVRNSIVYFILERQRFTEDEDLRTDVGIEKLIQDKVYTAAYPLHDGDSDVVGSQRNLLLNEWASIKKFIKHQPLDNIKDYFGVKVALYFAWLGFYTHMLVPAALVGVICFVYGLITLSSDKISDDICNNNNTIIMCPQCDAKCDYWYLKETCIYARVSYLFDNNLTVFFACFMSFWAVLYLELWKRYSAKLIHRWGLIDYSHHAEHPRPQYLARLKNSRRARTKFNVVRRVLEPHVPFWKIKFPVHLFSYSIVILFICIAISAVFGVVIYRMSQITSHNIYGNTDSMSYKIMVLPATAAIIDLIIITILNYAYDYLAIYLTNLEYRRTKTEYDESLTLKIYLFQFVNYYSSIFYIAFLKGKFVGYPAKYNRIFKFRQEECGTGGCLMELCIQLVIIMIGKQAINGILEMSIPYAIKTFNTVRHRFGLTKQDSKDHLISCNQWTEDYKLLPWSSRGLFEEYLEMVIQYGFITIFVVAFPLAPLFALFNNVLEMRLDAKKFLKYYRRPVSERAKDIGIWINVMSIIGRIAVFSSAFIIAFSSHFIPRLVYMSVNPEHTDVGYLNSTLAVFDTKDFQQGTDPFYSAFTNITTCRYSEYRNSPLEERKYKRPLIYWHILAARLAFIVVFQNIVGMVQTLVAWVIPDRPRKLRDQIKREEYLTREIIIEHEKNNSSRNRSSTNIQHLPNNNRNDNNGMTFNDIELIDNNLPTDFRRRRNNSDMFIDRTTPV